MMQSEYKIGIAKHIMLQRWWLRTRECESIVYDDGSIGASAEFYIPIWAWPFELVHRAIFGKAVLIGNAK